MGKIEKCKNASDIRIMIKENELKPLKGRISKEEYNRIWLESREKSETIWLKLLEKNKKFFERDGYIEVEYLGNGKYRRKPLPKGQPLKEEKKDKRIIVRLDAELEEKLKEYCEKNNISVSEAIRKAIKYLP